MAQTTLELIIKANGTQANKAMDDIKRQFATTRAEAEKLGRQSSVSMQQGAGSANMLRASLGRVALSLAAVAAASVSVRALVGYLREGVQAVEDFEQQVIGMAASLTSLDKNTTVENVGQQFQRMTGFVRGQIEEIQRLDSQYSGTSQELTRVYDVLLSKGVLVNTQIAEQREGFLAMAEALKFATRGQNFDVQVFQEINGLLDGTRMNTLRLSQFLGLAGAEADKFRQRLMGAKDASERGAILMEMMRTRAAGFVVASKEMGNTLTGVVSSLQSTWNIIQRQAFAGAWKDIAGFVRDINAALRDKNGNLTALGRSIVSNIQGAWEAVKGTLTAVWRIMTDPTVADALNIVAGAIRAIGWALEGVRPGLDLINRALGNMIAMLKVAISGWSTLINLLPGGSMTDKAIDAQAAELRSGDDLRRRFPFGAGRTGGSMGDGFVPNPRSAAVGSGGGGGSKSRKDPNAEIREALQRAVQTSQLIAERDNQTTEQQIKNLRKIYAEFSRTGALRKALAMELLALEARIASMERQRIDEQISKSREFIAHRKAMNQMSAQDEIAAQRRILATPGISRDERVRALREIDLIQKRQRDEAREAQQKAWDEARRLLQERVDAEERAAEEIIDIRRRIADATAASSLDEFAARRREIDREYNELLERLTATRSSNPNFQADTEAAAGAMTAAKARVDRDEALANLRKQLDASQALLDLEEERLRIGEGSAEAVTAARQAYLDQLTASMQLAETEAERLRILMQIAGIQSQIKMDSIRNDFKASLDYVTSEFQKRRFDWLTAMQTAAGDMERAMSDGFFKVMQGNLSGLSDIFGGILAAIQRQIANWLASQIVQQFLGIVNGGMGGGGGAGGGGALMQIFTGLIPGMAKGGVVFGPQMIMAGEGAEPEAIIPLSKLPTLARQAGGGGGPIVMQFNIQANDAGSFVEMAQRSRHGLADVVMSALNENNSLRRMLPDYR